MSGGNQYLDQVKITLKDRKKDEYLPVFIDIFDNSLSRKWLDSLNHLLTNDYHLEKNYCFLGFDKSPRNIRYLCEQINQSIFSINASGLDYTIKDYFTPENVMTSGPVGSGLPGMKVNHDKFNNLHRYFEDLQGSSGNISEHYTQANATIRWHIRQLNLLCHEAESLILSLRKAQHAPDWCRPSQLMCWLSAPRFKLDKNDLEHFGIHALERPFGGVFVGVNKAVGKHHWEVYKDEGADSRIDKLTTTNMASQTEAAGDFDIEWGQTVSGYQFWQEEVDGFVAWLDANGFDPNDPNLTIGHPQIGQVDFENSFCTDNFRDVWNLLEHYLDVYSVETSGASATYDYHWSDDNYIQQQVELL
jgi:hypothetical protein